MVGSRSLPRVTVTIVDVTTGARFTARTNAKGNVTFAAVPYDTYRIVTSGRSTVRMSKTIVLSQATRRISFKVRLARQSD